MLRSLGVSLACLLAGFTPAAHGQVGTFQRGIGGMLGPTTLPAPSLNDITVAGAFNPAALGGLTGRREDPRPTSAQVGRIKVEADVRSVPISGCVANKTNFVCQFPLSRQAAKLVYTLYDKDGKRLAAVPITNAHVVQADKKSCMVRLPFGRHADAVARLTITRAGDPAPAVVAAPQAATPAERPRSTAMDGIMADWDKATRGDKVEAMTTWLQAVQRTCKKPVASSEELAPVTRIMVDTMDAVSSDVSSVSARSTAHYILLIGVGMSEGKTLDEIRQGMKEAAAGK